MKNLFLPLIIGILFCTSSHAQTDTVKYEMKNYYFVLLKKGPTRTQDSVTVEQIQKGHMDNIGRLAGLGKLNVAGPFLDDGDLRGIFIFDVPTEKEVIELLNSDPAIKAGRLSYEIHPWMTAKGTCFK